MFKALLAASLAMLVCCAAAAWAGPVEPSRFREQAVSPPSELAPALRSALPLVAPGTTGEAAEHATLLDTVVVEGFVPVSLSATYDGVAGTKVAEDDVAPLGLQGHQPAVIPLPHPLAAAAVLLAILVIMRRLIIRTCRA